MAGYGLDRIWPQGPARGIRPKSRSATFWAFDWAQVLAVHSTVDLFIDVLDGANVPPLTVAAVDPDLLLAVKLEHCGIIGAGAGSHRETIRTGHDCAATVLPRLRSSALCTCWHFSLVALALVALAHDRLPARLARLRPRVAAQSRE
jgi:hypothetical protein